MVTTFFHNFVVQPDDPIKINNKLMQHQKKVEKFLKETCNGNYAFDFFMGEGCFNEYSKEMYGDLISEMFVLCFQLFDENGYMSYNMTGYFFGNKGKIEVYHAIDIENDDLAFTIHDLSPMEFFSFVRLTLDIEETSTINYIVWDKYKRSAKSIVSSIDEIKTKYLLTE